MINLYLILICICLILKLANNYYVLRRRDVILHFAAKDQFMDMASMVILRAFTKETIRSKVDYEQFEELQDIDYTGDRTGKK